MGLVIVVFVLIPIIEGNEFVQVSRAPQLLQSAGGSQMDFSGARTSPSPSWHTDRTKADGSAAEGRAVTWAAI